MRGGLVLLVITCQVRLSVSQVKGGCKKIDACSCQSDEGVVDLSPLAGDGGPMFKDLTSSTVAAWKFSWNPCKSFTFGQCVNVATCEYSNDGYGFFNLGTQESARFTTDSGDLLLVYNATEQGIFRGTQVTLICNPQTEKTLELLPLIGSPVAEFTLTSKYCCPYSGNTGTGLSAGSVCVILFAVLVLVYAVAGVVFQVGVWQGPHS